MGEEGPLSFSASVVEEVLQQHENRSRGFDWESRRAEEAGVRMNEAAWWLRETVGMVAWKDLPADPSEEEFRLGLRSGIILCNALNKIHPGAVAKVIESPGDAALIPDGAALSAFQYFENIRNFLVSIQEMGIPTFEASDLEQGGKSARVVNTILALKSYREWKQMGGNGVWKFGGNVKPPTSGKLYARKNSEPFINSLSRTSSSASEKSIYCSNNGTECNKASNSHFSSLIRTMLLDKKADEIPALVESVLNKVLEELEHRVALQRDTPLTEDKISTPVVDTELSRSLSDEGDDGLLKAIQSENCSPSNQKEPQICSNEFLSKLLKGRDVFDEQKKDIKELKCTLNATRAGICFMQNSFLQDFKTLETQIKSLAHTASGYQKVLEENRKLYNQVQDLKGNIRVYCRVRPTWSTEFNHSGAVDHIEDGVITIKNLSSKYDKGPKVFNLNKVFGPSASQAEVFSDMQPLVRSVLDGFNVCIFAYGQTGSGKTYTMTGPKDPTEETLGVNYRALSDLFFMAEQRKEIYHYNVSVQMIEIYNEQVRDLLVADGSIKKLEIRNSCHNGMSVPDASVIPVSTTAGVIDLMNLGHRNRAVGATALNDRSSRSHSCLMVHVHGKDLTSGVVLRGCMYLVDLAGSERVDKSEVTGDRLKEAQHINKSLSALGDVIASLAHKNSHVPYRNSKLTQLLQDSLGGQAKTLMFVHISPEAEAVGETLSTLKFAERVSSVELGAAKVNRDNGGGDVKELKEQVAFLKAALSRNGRQPMGEVGNLVYTSRKEEEDDDVEGEEWVDKVMLNKQNCEAEALKSYLSDTDDSSSSGLCQNTPSQNQNHPNKNRPKVPNSRIRSPAPSSNVKPRNGRRPLSSDGNIKTTNRI